MGSSSSKGSDEDMGLNNLFLRLKGGAGSGNWGHVGRIGKIGGSVPSSSFGAPMDGRIGYNLGEVHNASPEAKKAYADLIKLWEDAPSIAEENYKSVVAELEKELEQPNVTDRMFNDIVARAAAAEKLKYQHKEAIRERALDLVRVSDPAKFSAKMNDPNIDTEGIYHFRQLVSNSIIAEPNVKIKAEGIYRPHYDPKTKTAVLSKAAKGEPGFPDVIHELGHWVEHTNPDVKAKAVTFWQNRTGFEKDHNKIAPYESGTLLHQDKFPESYSGKIYVDHKKAKETGSVVGSINHTEIVSMGVEKMYTDPVKFAKEDPDYFAFTYDLLRGK